MSRLNQTITYWPPIGEDEYASPIFGAPQVIPGRWEDRMDQVRSPTGDLINSKAMVWLDIEFDIGGYLALGDHTGQVSPTMALASEIRSKIEIPDVRSVSMERRAIL